VASAWGWQPYHIHVPFVLKSGSLNLWEPLGPVQASNGIALPFTIFPMECICGFHVFIWTNSNCL